MKVCFVCRFREKLERNVFFQSFRENFLIEIMPYWYSKKNKNLENMPYWYPKKIEI
jgi:hypothetical protein